MSIDKNKRSRNRNRKRKVAIDEPTEVTEASLILNKHGLSIQGDTTSLMALISVSIIEISGALERTPMELLDDVKKSVQFETLVASGVDHEEATKMVK